MLTILGVIRLYFVNARKGHLLRKRSVETPDEAAGETAAILQPDFVKVST